MNKTYLLSDDCCAALTVANSRKACVQYLVEYHYIAPYDSVWDKAEECWKEIHECMCKSPDLITFDELVDWLIANWDDKEFNEYYHIEEISVYKECI